MKFKNFLIDTFFLTAIILFARSGIAMNTAEYSRITARIAGRAEIIKERVELFFDEASSRTPNLYYLILSFMEDVHGLYMLGDKESAQKKLLVLDTITYDLITTGCSAALIVNDAVGRLQASPYAGSMKEFKKIVEDNLGIISQRGLEKSIRFTHSEDAYTAANFNKLFSLRNDIQAVNAPLMVKNIFDSFEFAADVVVRHELPDSVQPPETGFILSLNFNGDAGISAVVMFEGQNISRISLLLALSKVQAFFTGMQTHNNESYESQFHYLILEMRYLDWIEKNKTKFGITDENKLKKIIQWYRASYEGLADESFVPRYYEQLLAGRAAASLDRVSFNWKKNFYDQPDLKQTRADDYLFCIQGNRSQVQADVNFEEFFKTAASSFPDGVTYLLGCGEGRNLPVILQNHENIRKIAAIDHSTIALSRLNRLEHFLPDFELVQSVRADVVSYKYPDKSAPLSERPNCAVLINVLEYLTFEERITLFSKLFHSLRDGGYVYIVVDMAEGSAFEQLESNEFIEMDNGNSTVKSPFWDPQIKHFFTRGEIEKELRQVGFREKNSAFQVTFHTNEFGFNTGVYIIKKQIKNKMVRENEKN